VEFEKSGTNRKSFISSPVCEEITWQMLFFHLYMLFITELLYKSNMMVATRKKKDRQCNGKKKKDGYNGKKKDRQYNGKKKRDKKTNITHQTKD
jgi:hypothetical protein